MQFYNGLELFLATLWYRNEEDYYNQFQSAEYSYFVTLDLGTRRSRGRRDIYFNSNINKNLLQ